MPRPYLLESVETDDNQETFIAYFKDGGVVQFTQTRERPYSGSDADFKWGEVHADFYKDALRFIKPNALVLDVGCGSGYGVEILTDAGHDVVGIDYSEEALKFARHRAPKARYIHRDIDKGLGAKADFDAVLLIESIEHVREDLAVLSEVFANMRPGGVLYMTTPESKGAGKVASPFHVREYTSSELKDIVGMAGFSNIEFHEVKRWADTIFLTARKPTEKAPLPKLERK